MSELINLLEKLTQLDPALCQHTGENMFTLAGRGICADFYPHYPRVYIDERELVLSWVQYATQQALDERKLSYNIRRRHPNAWKGVRAEGFAIDILLGDCWLMNDIYYPHLAEALLGAYAGALEAER